MKRMLTTIGVLVMCGSFAVPALAADKGWHLRAFAAGFDPDLDVIVPAENPDELRIKADSDLGFGASLEYQLNSLVGVELGFVQASPTIELSADDVPGFGRIALTDSMSTTATTLDLNFHLTPKSQYFDFYLGAGLANLDFGNLHYVVPDGDSLDLTTKDDLGFSAKANLGITLGRSNKWAAIGGLRYIWSDLELRQENTATLDFNIFSFSVGIAYSF